MSNLKDILISKIGTYQPQFITQLDGTIIYPMGIGSLDYAWLFSALMIVIGLIGFILIAKSIITAVIR